MMSDFDGRVAVVTGGASGIGAACARLLAARGCRVVVVDRDAEAARHVAAELGGLGFEADVTDRDALEVVRRSLETDGLIGSLLVNSAGIVQAPDRPDELSTEVFRRVIGIDLEGTFNACAVWGAAMAHAGRGAIVNIASVAGMRSMPLHAYSPAKAGVISLTEGLAAEWGRAGVRVNSVSPGYTLTPALQEQIGLGLRDPVLLAAHSALGQLIEPEQIARGVAFLLSEEAAMITGVNLPIDAGWLVAGSWSSFGGVRPARGNGG